MKKTAINSDKKEATRSVTFRLRADEIEFLEKLSERNITAGLRKLITFGRAVGCHNNLLQTSGADITLAIIARLERLEMLVHE